MNPKLQNIVDIVQQSEKLDAAQKNNLVKAVKDADKELEITAFKLERTEKVKKTTAILLEETIEELEQKRKAVEAQNHELEIEASLERVRAQALGMNKPDDLLNICEILFREFISLGFSELRNSMINIHNDDKKTFLNYDYSDEIGKSITPLDYNTHPVMEKQIKQSRMANDAFSEAVYKGKDLEEWKEFRRKYGEKDDPRIKNITALYYYFYSIGKGTIGISTFSPISKEKLTLLKRFRNVFSLAYRRYSDIALAEAQAREAKIEVSLERIRSRALGMHHSSEVKEVSNLLFSELTKMDINLSGFNIIVFDNDRESFEMWRAKQVAVPNEFESFSHKNMYDKLNHYLPGFVDEFESEWKSGKPYYMSRFTGEKRISFLKANSEVYNYSDVQLEKMKELYTDPILWYMVFFKQGWLGLICNEYLSRSELLVSHRFAEVFEFAYTRFLDIQKAEAQAREAEIQLALERVRARTMAMHTSYELADSASVLFHELKKLGIESFRSGIGIFDYDNDAVELWLVTETDGRAERKVLGRVTSSMHPMYKEWLDASRQKKNYYILEMEGDELKNYYETVSRFWQIPVPSEFKHKEAYHGFFFSEGTINIISPIRLSEDECKIVLRFAQVFEQTYTRFLDLQKAEAQAREARIEAALEKVRSRSLAMHKSNELQEVVNTVFERLKDLEIDMNVASIFIFKEGSKDWEQWVATSTTNYSKYFHIPYTDNLVFRDLEEAKNKGKDFYSVRYSLKQKNDWFSYAFKNTEYKQVPDERKKYILQTQFFLVSFALSRHSGIQIAKYEGKDFSQEENEILKRFSRVFEQAYIRFLDLQKAEAQAREAQIEAALERVRSRTMGMHKSEELSEVAALLFEQLTSLGIQHFASGFSIFDKNNQSAQMWWNISPKPFPVDFNASPVLKRVYDTWEKGEPFYINQTSGEEFIRHIEFLRKVFGERVDQYMASTQKKFTDAGKKMPDHMVMHHTFFAYGSLLLNNITPIKEQEILTRFAKVFEQTYTRFLDLQKAEAQAREAQIEAGLERVRSRSMGMHSSDELREVVAVLYNELGKLNFEIRQCVISILNDKEKFAEWWSTGFEDKILPKSFIIPYDNQYIKDFLTEFKNIVKDNIKYRMRELSGEGKRNLDKTLFEHTDLKNLPEDVKKEMMSLEKIYLADAFMKYGMLEVVGPNPISADKGEIIQRFAKVFEQTYTRFLDLQKAETQAHEAQIETALEKVRSRSMGMHKSNELQNVVSVVFEQLQALNFALDGAALIATNVENFKGLDFWMEDKVTQPSRFRLPYYDSPSTNDIYDARLKGKDFIVKTYGTEKNIWFEYAFEHTDLKIVPEDRKRWILAQSHLTQAFALQRNSMIGIHAHHVKILTDNEIDILKRFSKVFEQAYVRFLDLQKAEAQAGEAVKQASLDRVRGKIASMRTAEDLNRITPIIWNELKTLEVPFIRCGVFIIDEEKEMTRVYLTTPDGKSLGVLNLSFDANKLTTNTVDYWRRKEVYKEHWNKDEFINWTKSMMELGQVQNAETYQGSSAPPESLNLHFVPFTQGMLYVGDISPLTYEKLDLVKTLAEAFSIAYARYEDFKNLEEAKNKIELTFNELKSAQAQLIHAEKLASLGELTAGIAHEIKNPLNFVNNFSDLSKELLDEIKTELKNNNKEEILAILEDLKLNLDKINQHGKRADSIVKGMLLHSRGTSGEKSLTDINDLLEQYVNLAYHGMRAQNKEFNITIEKDFDETLEKINVVPQDISRVFLNIINNACYAAYERKKKSIDDNFSPTLKVSTKKLKGKVEIRIGDNGNGIPGDILDKIFQPFFTTKPTGEGTGLGLSLSYDIVTKVHGGELKVETKEEEGTEFIIYLNI